MSTDSTPRTAPLTVPDRVPAAVPGGVAPAAAVSDDDRNRYGVLLDHAAERGLLSPSEYQARLAELADATSEDELRRIVTELPAFGPSGGATAATSRTSPVGSPSAGVSDPAAVDSALWAQLTPATTRRRAGNPWAALAVLVVVLLVALVVLAVVASHLAHTHHTGALRAGVSVVSRLRL